MTNNLTALCQADMPYLTGAGITTKRCLIYDGRKGDLEFHRNGFELRHIPREVTDWTDEAEIQRLEYPAFCAFVRSGWAASR